MTDIEWYLDFIRDELTKLKSSRFVGNIEIKFNWRDGNIQHINLGLHKSVKKPG